MHANNFLEVLRKRDMITSEISFRPMAADDWESVAEVSIYISNNHKGQQVGTKLLGRLIAESEKEKFWTLESGIFPENVPSIKIHEKLGFRQVGYHEKIGKMRGIWRDTILLERRSKVMGIESVETEIMFDI